MVGLCPDPLGSLQRSSEPYSWIKGSLLLRERVWEMEYMEGGEGREERGEEGKGTGRGPPPLWILDTPLCTYGRHGAATFVSTLYTT